MVLPIEPLGPATLVPYKALLTIVPMLRATMVSSRRAMTSHRYSFCAGAAVGAATKLDGGNKKAPGSPRRAVLGRPGLGATPGQAGAHEVGMVKN